MGQQGPRNPGTFGTEGLSASLRITRTRRHQGSRKSSDPPPTPPQVPHLELTVERWCAPWQFGVHPHKNESGLPNSHFWPQDGPGAPPRPQGQGNRTPCTATGLPCWCRPPQGALTAAGVDWRRDDSAILPAGPPPATPSHSNKHIPDPHRKSGRPGGPRTPRDAGLEAAGGPRCGTRATGCQRGRRGGGGGLSLRGGTKRRRVRKPTETNVHGDVLHFKGWRLAAVGG